MPKTLLDVFTEPDEKERTMTTIESTCRHCGYQWITKKDQPRKCPDCYRRWPLRQVDPATKAKEEVSNG